MNGRSLIHATLDALAPTFTDDVRPRARLAAAMPLLDGSHPAIAAFADAARASTRGGRGAFGIAVRTTARLDGATIAEAQQFFGAFNPSRRLDLSTWQFDTLRGAGTPGEVARHVGETLELLDPGGSRRASAWVFPADHANAHTMLRLHGLEAWGDLPDGVAVQVWPTAGNLARLGPVLTRATALGFRSGLAWPDRREPTLADHLVREGLASHAVSARFPGLSDPWSAPFRAPDDWDDALATVAAAAGVARYADMQVNVYGVCAPAGDVRLPVPMVLDDDEAAYATAVLAADLDTSDPARIAAYLYGDAVVAMGGHPPAGMSSFAGIAAAHALVGKALARLSLTLPSALRLPAATLLDAAFA